MRNNHKRVFSKKVFRVLNYFANLLILVSTVTECVSISAFASLVGIPVSIANFVIGIKICPTTAGIKKYKSIIEKAKKKHDEIVVLAKAKLHTKNIKN